MENEKESQKSPDSQNGTDNGSSDIGDFALKHKLISRAILDKAYSDLAILASKGKNITLEFYLLKKGYITKKVVELHEKLLHFKSVKSADRLIGKKLIDSGFATENDIKGATAKQLAYFKASKKIKRISGLLIAMGVIKEDQLRQALTELDKDQKKQEKNGTSDTIVHAADHIPQEKITIPTLTIGKKNLEAYVTIPEITSKKQQNAVTYDVIERLIIDNYIKYGLISREEIEKKLTDNMFKQVTFRIASGKPAREGKPPEIITHFHKEFLDAGKVSTGGIIDFRDRGEVPHVKEGELLAEKVPMDPGEPGINVFGQTIGIQPVKDIRLKSGPGTTLADDKHHLYAKVDGQPTLLIRDKIAVMKSYEVNGDVDYSTGHIKFQGNIVISGKILNGFKVQGVNVICGDLDGGVINATGNVEIKGGVSGGTIITQGGVTAHHISKANVDALNDIIVDKQIIDSKIATSGMLAITHGQIVNSKIVARKGIKAHEIGTLHTKPCRLGVGRYEHIEKEFLKLRETIAKSEGKYESVKKNSDDFLVKLKSVHSAIIENAVKQDKNIEEQDTRKRKIQQCEAQGNFDQIPTQKAILEKLYKENQRREKDARFLLTDQDKALEKVLESITKVREQEEIIIEARKELEELEKWSEENPGDPVVYVGYSISEKTFIAGPNSEITIMEKQSKCTIAEVSDAKDDKKNSEKNSDTDSVKDDDIHINYEMVIEK